MYISGGGTNEKELEAAASKLTEGSVCRLPCTTTVLLLWNKHPFENFMNTIGSLLARDPDVGPGIPSEGPLLCRVSLSAHSLLFLLP